MSPRRRIDPTTEHVVAAPKPKRRLRWRLPVVSTVAALLIAGVIAVSTLMLVSHEIGRRQAIRDAAVLGYVRSFMTDYTSLDPYHANAYADRIVAQGTGDFVKAFRQRQNEIMLTVARAEPTTGSVMDAGVSRWNDDGSADVLVATKIVTTGGPDGKTMIESGNRWLATAIKEGQQWKIDRLVQVI